MADETQNQEPTEIQAVENNAVETPAEVKVEEIQAEPEAQVVEAVEEPVVEEIIEEPGIIAGALKKDLPALRQGDMVKIYQKIKEIKDKKVKERIQIFEGTVIRRKGGSIRENFTVRKVSQGIGVERIFPLHSPKIEKIEVTRRGRVRRAKLYYLRDRVGKATRIKEKKRVQ